VDWIRRRLSSAGPALADPHPLGRAPDRAVAPGVPTEIPFLGLHAQDLGVLVVEQFERRPRVQRIEAAQVDGVAIAQRDLAGVDRQRRHGESGIHQGVPVWPCEGNVDDKAI